MNCQDMARILDEQEVDSLLAEDNSGVRTHLNACSECARDWRIHAQLTSAAIPAVPAVLRAQFSPQMASASSGGGHRRNGLVAVGALVVLAAAAATMLVQKKEGEPSVAAMKDSGRWVPSVTQVLSDANPSSANPGLNDEPKAMAELKEWTRSVAEWLMARDDADALMTAALLVHSDSGDAPEKISSLLKRAAEKAPDSARVQAMAMMLCFVSKPCDATPYERALRRIAPDNALGWVLDTIRASQAGDQEALRSALARMSRTKTYDLYENARFVMIISRLREALVPFPRVDESSPPLSRDRFALEVFADFPGLQFSAIQKFCKSARDENVLAECHQVAAAMRAGDSFMENLAGISIGRYGLPADSAEARSLAQQERQIRWIDYARQVEIRWIEDSDYLAQYPRLLGIIADHPREIDVWRAVLEEQGISTEPPADWRCSGCGKSAWD